MKTNIHFRSNLTQLFSEGEIFQKYLLEEIKTQFFNFFFLNKILPFMR